MLTGPAPQERACRAAVLGSPIDHSRSPVLHRAAYAALGLEDWHFERFAVGGRGEPTLEEFLDGRGPEWLGFAVTMPLKEDALRLASAASAHARQMGAANTLVRGDGGWIAESTDSVGALEALVQAGVAAPRSALVIGAGATARSVLDAVARLGVRGVSIATRRGARPETHALAGALGLRVTELTLSDPRALGRAVAEADVTVSTLPTGTRLALPPMSADALTGRHVMDVVYADWPTPFAAWAMAGGATAVNGLDMLVHQAAEQIRLMTGRTAPVEVMRAALQSDL